ncbi:MAG: TIGR00730 family Rossman fold protein [Gemmatimonadota bacterium]
MSASTKGPRNRVPSPPHPTERHQPLPEYEPKSPREDPEAPDRVRAVMQDPSYAPADLDLSFLSRDDTRGVRLQLDYMKPELLMREQGIRHTIVVFGSTRILEPKHARRRVEELEAALESGAADETLVRRLSVARRVLENSRYYEVAREFGRLVGESEGPPGKRVVIMTGGGPGIMEAANRGATEAGARSVGLNITLPHEQFPNPYLTPGLCFGFHYFAVRKLHFVLRARALVAFPGGYGTLDELFETLTLIQTRKLQPVPVVLVGESYWRRVVDLDFLVAEGTIEPEDRELIWFAETADQIWEDIRHWYRGSRTQGERSWTSRSTAPTRRSRVRATW